ncbi:MAG: leucine--tRNA ligase [Ardenticatenaceae bacterium]|nr:leucine--tRNA ligase [Ardenticatenaceae bacterium]MCB9442850.1 leucine--tRNA ligase [Ardenticatenaceae bacterium]
MNKKYDFRTVEENWRAYWDGIDLYRTGDDPNKPDIYILDYFPYPSGDGLSVGHTRNYVPSCVSARYHRMKGYNVLHPMGWDAFGLPAENYAIKHNIHPRQSTKIFTDTYRRQMKLVECSYDWSREINSTFPNYYRWTQWFFLLLYRRGLAYRAAGSQWWCPTCQTILANEQVENGRCWRCNTPVVKKDLEQWYFKITEYAARLAADLDKVDWPESIKTMQRNWIGRSEGAEVVFPLLSPSSLRGRVGVGVQVFTTRPDTLFGVTFLVLAPEHPLVVEITTPEQADAVQTYVTATQRMTEIDRMAADKEKMGVFTGATAVHPLTGQSIPIWIADYVLMGYGTGAVMGVPGHDERDYAFAQKFGLPIVEVISPDGQPQGSDVCFTGYGVMINSGPYSGMTSAEGSEQIIADLAAQGKGRRQVTYKMRDWLISRQRYWGAPIPIIHCPTCGVVPVPEENLPVLLPDTNDFAPAGDGRSPLARVAKWVNTTCPQCGSPAQRETDTMDGFACSSWYFLRFANPHYDDGPFDPTAVRRWLPVDTYVGGAEHAVMHLLYSRFWTKVMADASASADAGLIDFDEPFSQLLNQGMLLSAVDGQKMSKSKGNVVTPDEVVAKHGTDALRAYILFLGPFEAEVTWDDIGIKGVTRFLDRYWRLVTGDWLTSPHHPGDQRSPTPPPVHAFERARHKFIQRVTREMEGFRFNTAVAGYMEYLKYLIEMQDEAIPPEQWRQAIETLTLLLAPICPFITEEVWQTVLGHTDSVHRQAWPGYDETMTVDEVVTVVIQVNGKVRDRIEVVADVSEAVLRETAVTDPKVQSFINGKPIRKVIVIPPSLVNIVI